MKFCLCCIQNQITMLPGRGKAAVIVAIIGAALLVLFFSQKTKVQILQLLPGDEPVKKTTLPHDKPTVVSTVPQNDPNDNSPIGLLRRNGMLVLPATETMKSMTQDALFQTYHSYLDNIELKCNRKLRMGNIGDGGWEVCDDPEFRPSKQCLVYSFGINNDFSFDDDIAKVYNCSVVAFDPSMKKESHQRSPNVYFLKMGIGAGTKKTKAGWELRSLGSFKSQLKHTKRVLDVLKMDVEEAEWDSLPEIIKSEELRKVKQLLIEYHGTHPDKETLLSHLGILKNLYDIGFRKFYVHKNVNCPFKNPAFPVIRTGCYEIHYVNINKPV